MSKTEVKIIRNYYIDEDKIDLNKLNGIIQVEEDLQLYFFSEIKLFGKYNKTLTLLANFANLTEKSVCIDGDLMIIAISCSVLFYDLKNDRILKTVDIDTWTDDCAKLGNGYFVHGELDNFFFNKNYEIVWTDSCGDIFENMKIEDVFEIGKDYVAVFDWFGIKHFYNQNGEFKTEKYKAYDMNQ